jgi:hypothetical protein
MKKCPSDNSEFPDDHRYCANCGAALVEEFEMVTLKMSRKKPKQAEFLEMNDDFTFQLSIHNQTYKLSMDEIRSLGDEIRATFEMTKFRPDNQPESIQKVNSHAA